MGKGKRREPGDDGGSGWRVATPRDSNFHAAEAPEKDGGWLVTGVCAFGTAVDSDGAPLTPP